RRSLPRVRPRQPAASSSSAQPARAAAPIGWRRVVMSSTRSRAKRSVLARGPLSPQIDEGGGPAALGEPANSRAKLPTLLTDPLPPPSFRRALFTLTLLALAVRVLAFLAEPSVGP